MSKLTDKEIRAALKSYLNSGSPIAVLEEVRVHNGNAVADVVAVYEVAHCYEIKGETDELRRIQKQGPFYDQVFKNITLVTTANHLTAALRIAPQHWGILIAEWGRGGVEFRAIRSAGGSTAFDKELALLTLWKSELLALCDETSRQFEKFSKAKISSIIAGAAEEEKISHHIGQALAKRQTNNGWSFTM